MYTLAAWLFFPPLPIICVLSTSLKLIPIAAIVLIFQESFIITDHFKGDISDIQKIKDNSCNQQGTILAVGGAQLIWNGNTLTQ